MGGADSGRNRCVSIPYMGKVGAPQGASAPKGAESINSLYG